MAISEPYTNSASISTTEYSLPNNSTTRTPITVDGIYQVIIDFSAMVVGDQYVVKVYEKVTSGGSEKTIGTWTLTGAQPYPLVLPSMILLHGWDVTVDLITGSARTIAWSIRSVA